MSYSSTHWDPGSYGTNSDLQFAITEALRYREKGHARGKVVLTVE